MRIKVVDDFESPLTEKINSCWAAAREIHGRDVFKTEWWDETREYKRFIPKYNRKPKYKKKRLVRIR